MLWTRIGNEERAEPGDALPTGHAFIKPGTVRKCARNNPDLVARGKPRSRIQSNKSVGIFATFECLDDMVGNWRRAVALTD